MLARITRAASVVLFTAAAAAPVAMATDDSAPRVEYRYFGQGAYVLVLPPRALQQPPYALTGPAPHMTDDTTLRPGTIINVGQGRYIVPATR